MQAEFIRESNAAYMRLKGTPKTDIAQMKMAAGNEIDGFLRVSERRINDELYFMYDISSLIGMESVYEDREISAADMRRLAAALRRAAEAVREYLLDMDGVVLEPDKIYTDTGRESFRLCYFSGKETSFDEDIKALFEYIIRRLCHSDGEAVTIAYGIYKRICGGENSPERLFEIEEREQTGICELVEEKTAVSGVIPETSYSEEERKDKRPLYAAYALAGILGAGFILFLAGMLVPGLRLWGMSGAACAGGCFVTGAAAFFGYKWFAAHREGFVRIVTVKEPVPFEKKEVRILVPKEKAREENLTVFLGSESPVRHYLRWEEVSGTRRYEIGENPVIVGCDSKRADCVIALPGVSRMHARISKEGGAYYIKDLNSTNGTSVDGRALSCFELCEIKPGGKIILGNVECVFV